MQFLSAAWQVPITGVSTLSTTRVGGVSEAPFKSLNLGLHVGDNKQQVLKNRALLDKHLPNSAVWIDQVHSGDVLIVDGLFKFNAHHQGDALYTQLVAQPLAIMTADCLPILLASNDGKEVAAIHAGWRGLEQSVIKNTLNCFNAKKSEISAWLGPAIGPDKFEVGSEVFALFNAQNPLFAKAFKACANQKYLADIYHLARIQLRQLGVINITGGEHCTVSQTEQFFSYRRDGQTGRMASLIWRN
ncbi:peptidoglycan editing factor PgeF [Pseudoalteromonas sp. HL-AS2]|uniref:peptidoglycan editing factor PgeF n=1 Tax=Pseudoalteromonas sp. HL-AS2 TaxID=3071082 RepID=UPI0028167142|nr:peptidoglycan editing factor PgeF [Pseudoalteromonas sp. HL-AS2]WMS95382.1 peptidoglycan editing factor PgeF [Pseudoalteromonas sp. HL-AS2]